MADSDSVSLTPLVRPEIPRTEERDQPAPGTEPGAQVSAKSPKVPGWLAVVCIAASLLMMIGVDLVRQNWMYPRLQLPAGGFPFAATGVTVSPGVADAALWIAGLVGTVGLAAGLVAARRGARPPMRPILIAAGVVVAVLAVLPPAGSTDILDYASYGRLLVLGHNPYIATPHLLRISDPGFGLQVPWRWQSQVSLYGPIATFEQYVAARLAGDNIVRVAFWLKLWNTIGFAAVAIAADRVLRADPDRRLRAHLLWTVNPLMIWGLIAAGHLDVLPAAAGLLGLLALGTQSSGRSPTLARAVLAGALVGIAGDFKINYLAFGLGLAWVLRRRPLALLAAGAGGLVALVPAYAWFGTPAITALFARRNKSTVDSFYRLTDMAAIRPYLGEIGVVLVVGLGILLLMRLPAADPLRPALRPVLAVSLAWLVFWPYQLPWYDAMAFCVLLLYPATRLDWLLIGRLAAGTLANMPGNPGKMPGHVLNALQYQIIHTWAPGVLLGCAIVLVVFALTGWWGTAAPVPLVSVPVG
jgi:alpha-1,6-mannosyltransferase